MTTAHINHKAVWLSVLAQQLLGFLWHSPFLFGRLWMKLLQIDPFSLKLSPVAFGVAVLSSVFLAYSLAWFTEKQGPKPLWETLKTTVWLWIGLCFMSTATNYAFIGIHWGVLLIDCGISLVNLLVTVFILHTWKK